MRLIQAISEFLVPGEESAGAKASAERGRRDSSESASPLARAPETVCLRNGQAAFIRLVERTDGPLLYEQMMSMSEESRRLFCPYPFDRSHAEAIAAEAGSNRSMRLLALVDSKPAGYAYFTTNNAKRGFPMVGIGVTDEFQGMGLGRSLMDRLVEAARGRGYRGLELHVFKDNYRAQKLYLSLGFAFNGEADWGRQYSMRLSFAEAKPAGQ